MSVRLALGAGRWRIMRQVLAESLLLSFMGGALGLLMGYCGRTALPSLISNSWDQVETNVPFSWKVFVFTAGITVGTGILFGLLPAWSSTRAEIGAALKQGSQTASRRRKAWTGKAIVAFQVALSTLLVMAAGLFIQTLFRLNSVDPGFRPDHLILFDISAPSQRYAHAKDVALHVRLEESLRSVPGVQGLSASGLPFLAGESMNGGFYLEGVPELKGTSDEVNQYPYYALVGTDFLSVMKIPMLAGRTFNARDTETSPPVSIINESLARKFFPNQNPIGKRFSTLGPDDKDRKWVQIVGICRDTRYDSLRTPPGPLHFELYRQQDSADTLTYIVRTGMKPEAIVPSLRAAVQRIDRDLPLMDVRTQREQIDATTQQERMFATLTAGFGVLALALACVGIYGIMAYTVSQRTNEIGIRLALGAERGQVRGMVLREASWLAVFGVAAGLAVALALGRVVKSMLYGLQPADPLSLAGAGCLLLAVALLSGWVPAMRAARVEPMEALRHE
jgi:predicted permease